MGQRKQHCSEFKARLAVEAVKGQKTINEIARQYEVHPVRVSQEKKELAGRLPEEFGRTAVSDAAEPVRQKERRKRKVGEQTMDFEILKKCIKLSIPLNEPR